MSEDLKIISEPGKILPPLPIDIPKTGEVQNSITAIPVTEVESSFMIMDTVNSYVQDILQKFGMEPTKSNYEKIIMSLNHKVSVWLETGDVLLDDINTKEAASKYFEQACNRRGLKNTADNWNKIAKILKEQFNL